MGADGLEELLLLGGGGVEERWGVGLGRALGLPVQEGFQVVGIFYEVGLLLLNEEVAARAAFLADVAREG